MEQARDLLGQSPSAIVIDYSENGYSVFAASDVVASDGNRRRIRRAEKGRRLSSRRRVRRLWAGRSRVVLGSQPGAPHRRRGENVGPCTRAIHRDQSCTHDIGVAFACCDTACLTRTRSKWSNTGSARMVGHSERAARRRLFDIRPVMSASSQPDSRS